jgi:hypothetical protein
MDQARLANTRLTDYQRGLTLTVAGALPLTGQLAEFVFASDKRASGLVRLRLLRVDCERRSAQRCDTA